VARWDVVVVGGGSMGLASAWHLAGRGRRVLLCERHEPGHLYGSSHGATRIFRTAYRDPAYTRFALEALHGWRELEADAGEPLLDQAGAQMVKRLAVSAAFHSRYMAEAEREFASFLDPFELRAPRIPVLSNVTARPHEPLAIKTMLIRQITHPVRWSESVQWLLQQPEPEFGEVGPGNVLASLVHRIKAEPRIVNPP
jgi:glycine/D-amino acid oxidase-like deaminating enzyme